MPVYYHIPVESALGEYLNVYDNENSVQGGYIRLKAPRFGVDTKMWAYGIAIQQEAIVPRWKGRRICARTAGKLLKAAGLPPPNLGLLPQ